MSQPTDDSLSQTLNNDDPIDLRRYILAVAAWWKEILLIAAISGLLAGGAVYYANHSAPPSYRAVADIVIARFVSDVTLDERVSTQSEDVGSTASMTARRGALAQLALSGAIAQAVFDEMGPALPESRQNPSALMKMVEVDVPKAEDGKTPSDIIRITVTASNPELAADIANSWASNYIKRANAVFGELPAEVFDAVQAELTTAERAYQKAQKAYEKFLATSRVDALTRQINEKTLQRNNLQLGRDTILNAIADQDRNARLKLFTDLASTQTQALYRVLNEQSQAQLKDLSQLYADLERTNRFLDLARNLEEQITLGGDEAALTSHQALQTLKNQVYTLPDSVRDASDTSALAPNITFITSSQNPSSAAEQLKDVVALVTALENESDELNARIAESSDALLNGRNYSFLDRMSADSLFSSTSITSTIVVDDEKADDAIAEPISPTSDVERAILKSYLDLFEVSDLVQMSQNGYDFILNSSLDQTIRDLETTLQQLRAELAAEMSTEQQLLQQRDLAWNSYDALSNKAAELSFQRSSTGSEVRLGSGAITPNRSTEQTDPLLAAIAAAFFGVIAGILIALIGDYMGYAPPLSRSRKQPA